LAAGRGDVCVAAAGTIEVASAAWLPTKSSCNVSRVTLRFPLATRFAMINAVTIDELAQRLSALVPPGMREARDDLGRNFRAVLQSGLGKLDLVTREEFDVQRCVLLRTREKIEQLERQLAALEASLSAQPRH
jgi:BMFP domain-containing protein YqiC